MDRVILHVDMNSFFASVETLAHPEAASVPMAVCGDAQNRRGIILAKNELAKSFGVQTAEPIWQAQKKCPELMLLPPHHDLYYNISKQANAIYCRYTDLVEPASVDESYLDVTASERLFGSGEQIAMRIHEDIKNELGLTVSIGVSFCKIFAKMGSDYKKPDATTIVTRESFRELMYPLPVKSFMYVGRATQRSLKSIGVETIGDLARLSERTLTQRLGKHGAVLYRNVHGLDDGRVLAADEREPVKSIGNSLTYRRDLTTVQDIRAALAPLAESVGARLRAHGFKCRGIQVAVKSPDFMTVERQSRLENATFLSREIYRASLELVLSAWKPGSAVRLLSVTAIQLVSENESEQISFFSKPQNNAKLEALDRSKDKIRAKFGNDAIKPASILKNDLGIK